MCNQNDYNRRSKHIEQVRRDTFMLDMETLRIIWWVLLGVLIIGFAITDGFDFGVGTLLPLVAKTETERRVVLNTIGPVWEGNQVWIVLGAGAIFAAWPYVYAVAFSGFYLLILLLLLSMGISRPVSFKYRSKLPSLTWRRFWDRAVFFGGFFPAVIFGILVGNVIQGVPFYYDENLRLFYTGTFFGLFNPFALFCGLTSLSMLIMHGGFYLAVKTEDPIRSRAIHWARWMSIFLIVFFAVGGWWVSKRIYGYELMNPIDHYGASNPLHKYVEAQIGGWINNYSRYPIFILAPVLGFAGAILAFLTAPIWESKLAFIFSSISIVGVITTVGCSIFPFILPSSTNLASGLLIWDASSSNLTLMIMLIAVLIFMPLILIYTSWVYRVMRGKVRNDMIETDQRHIAY
jgi:cytochrome bd ubiquinol oxidase subunit II